MHLKLRASAIVLTITLAATLSSQAYAECLKGYYRFSDTQTETTWKARNADYAGEAPHGLSVFEDLSTDQYNAMAAARNLELGKSKTLIYRVSCAAAATGSLDVTADPTNLTNWTQAGGRLHAVIGYDGAATADEFNEGMVGGKTTPTFLFEDAVFVTRVPPAP